MIIRVYLLELEHGRTDRRIEFLFCIGFRIQYVIMSCEQPQKLAPIEYDSIQKKEFLT